MRPSSRPLLPQPRSTPRHPSVWLPTRLAPLLTLPSLRLQSRLVTFFARAWLPSWPVPPHCVPMPVAASSTAPASLPYALADIALLAAATPIFALVAGTPPAAGAHTPASSTAAPLHLTTALPPRPHMAPGLALTRPPSSLQVSGLSMFLHRLSQTTSCGPLLHSPL